MVISVLNPKGGVGKSTTSIHLARGLQLAGHTTTLLDADPQGSALEWAAKAGVSPTLQVLRANHDSIEALVANMAPAPDYIVIDGAAKLEKSLIVPAIRVSDIVIIPVQPSALDIWGASELVEVLKMVIEARGRPRTAFLITRQVQGTALAGDIGGVLTSLGIGVFESRLTQRVAFTESISAGQTVLEFEPGGKAAAEINNLVEEVLRFAHG